MTRFNFSFQKCRTREARRTQNAQLAPLSQMCNIKQRETIMFKGREGGSGSSDSIICTPLITIEFFDN